MPIPIQAPPVVRNISQAKLNMNSVLLSSKGPHDEICPGECCCIDVQGTKACVPCTPPLCFSPTSGGCVLTCLYAGYASPC